MSQIQKNKDLFAKKFKTYRKKAGKTQKALAELMGFERKSVSRWENSKHDTAFPDRDVLIQLKEDLQLNDKALDELLLLAGYAPINEEIIIPPRKPLPPLPATGLFGRADDVAWLKERLTTEGRAAVAGVRGIGGIGKTALAITVAHQLANTFEGGVLWAECGPNSVEAVQDQIAAEIEVKLEAEDVRLRANELQRHLAREPQTLIVLDDVRLAHKDGFDYLQPPAPHALLITSRRMDVLNSASNKLRLDELGDAAAKGLLGQEVGGTWVQEGNDEVVEAILGLLENIPLALILAGRWLNKALGRRNPPAEPLAYLLENLVSKRKQLLNQDHTKQELSLRLTFRLSYDELDEENQRRIQQIGIFGLNHFPKSGLGTVWQMETEEALADAIQQLENSGLIQEYDEGVYWMHDVLREYAGELLADDAETHRATQQAHAHFCHQLLNAVELKGVDSWLWLTGFMPEVLQAGRWLQSNWLVNPTLAIDLAITLSNNIYINIHIHHLLISWLRIGIKATNKLKISKRKLSILYCRLADSLVTCSDFIEAEKFYDLSIKVFYEIEDMSSLSIAQSSLADLKFMCGNYSEAEHLYKLSLKSGRNLIDNRSQAIIHTSMAKIFELKEQKNKAESLYRNSINIFIRCQDVREQAIAQTSLADLLVTSGNFIEAEDLYLKSISLQEKINDFRHLAISQSGLANLLFIMDRIAEAENLYRRSLKTKDVNSDFRSIAITQSNLADLLTTRGQYDEAKELYYSALKLKEKIGDSREIAITQSSLANLFYQCGQYDEAEHLYHLSLDYRKKSKDPRGIASTQIGLAYLMVARQETQKAISLIQESLILFAEIDDSYNLGATAVQLAKLLIHLNQKAEAIPYLEQAQQIFEQMQASNWLETVAHLLAQANEGSEAQIDLSEVIGWIKQGLAGDRAQGQQAWDFAQELMAQNDATSKALGFGLLRLVSGVSPQKALADLPPDLRDAILALLEA